MRRTETLGINVPAGIDDGQVLNIPGKGNAGQNGGPAGDLQIQVSVRPHPLFERDGFNIWYELAADLRAGGAWCGGGYSHLGW